MPFSGLVLTLDGKILEAKYNQGKTPHFTRVAIGDGDLGTGTRYYRSALVSEKKSLLIDAIQVINSTDSAIITTLKNEDITTGFNFREIGIFAEDPDTHAEKLYLYDNAGTECEPIPPASSGQIVNERLKFIILIDSAAQVTFDPSGNPLYLTIDDINDALTGASVLWSSTKIAAFAIPKSTATAADQVLVSTGAGAWAAKTLTQLKAWLSLAASDVTDFAASVRSVVLTGLSTASSAAITAADTVISAFGKLQAQITAHSSDAAAHAALFASKLSTSLKGVANGLAELDSSGKVPSWQLPSYVDDVLEYATLSAFPATGESGKIYVAINNGLTYRWSGSGYAEISQSLALGETSATAYRGDRGKAAYDHSQASGAQHGATSAATPNAMMCRDGNGRAKVGAPYDYDDTARKDTVMGAGKWNLLQSYTAPGTYTFVVPDLYGDGRSYQIGVYMIGGGGSGAVTTGTQGASASGGASGCARNVILTVTPGMQLAAVVGAGGNAITDGYANGNAGGSSGFNGFSASGGSGGSKNGIGANGGQGSDAIGYGNAGGTSKYGGVTPIYITDSSSYGLFGGLSQSPKDCQNAFDSTMTMLAAGGGAFFSGSPQYQSGATLPDGTKGGNGAAGNSGTTAQSATGYGNGGGACVVGTGTGTSGAGAPGGVWIYARGL